ncbi:ABC transporter G family member 25 [Phalaenopsis equestris]|uniref:ABC transporter G family member 25 n=1 Tax=Phalaenopsis equestris TaxID=78828 RepID=UPI0009E4C295|nr:ABC transporter G family member 25 [Phalaenopsis equestris]
MPPEQLIFPNTTPQLPNPARNRSSDRSLPSDLSSPHPLSLHFVDVCYRVKLTTNNTAGIRLTAILSSPPPPSAQERSILEGITGIAAAGELLAVLGPSGSGKSTFLTILAGRNIPSGGSIIANGRKATRSVFRRIGFVPQDDVLYPHLTVRETLTYCAMLRLPGDRVRESVEGVMAELGLKGCGETVVKGVSGGERKRVAIGHEMLVNPSAVVVDEPTSGLDSTAAGRMVETLAGMARKGRAVVASIHQPASRVYGMFDSVMLMAEGRCIYYGRGRDAVDYFASIGFVSEIFVNPADFMLDLANGVTRTDHQADAADKATVKQSLISSYNKVLAPKVKASVNSSIAASMASAEALRIGSQRTGKKETKDFSTISWFKQFSILLRRSLRERRHETFNSLRVFQVMAAAFLAGLMWWHSSIHDVQDRLGLLFFISIFWGVFASFNAVFTFPQERVIVNKERASGMYPLSSYFMARMVGDLPMELVLPAIFVLIIYWMASLRPELGAFLLTMVVILGYVLVAQGLGLVIGAAIMNAKQASTIVTITMLAFLLTGGFYVQKVPICMKWLKYTSFTFYCFRLLIGVQYREDEISFYRALSHNHDITGDREAEVEGQVSVMTSMAALVIMFFGYRILAYAALRRIKV